MQERCASSSLAAAAGTSWLFFCLSSFQQGVCLHLQEAESKKKPHSHTTVSVSPHLSEEQLIPLLAACGPALGGVLAA